MEKEITKLNETTLRVVKTVPVASEYKLDYLIEQRAKIVASRDAELAEVDELISQCKTLEVKSEKAITLEEVVASEII